MLNNDKSYHQELLRQMRERIEVAYVKAENKRLADPIVVVFDLTDPLSERILELLGRGNERIAMIEEARQRGVQATAALHITGDYGARLFASEGRESVATLIRSGPDPGKFIVVIVADGTLSVVACPVPGQ